MKTVVNCVHKSNVDFPKLMKSSASDMVVLMSDSKGRGVVINVGNSIGSYTGEIYNEFNIGIFEDFKGSVTLSND